MANRARPSGLRLVLGTVRTACDDLGDRPQYVGRPEVPPGVALSEREQQLWDHTMTVIYNPAVHGREHAWSFVQLVRLLARAEELDRMTARLGLLEQLQQGDTRVIKASTWSVQSRLTWKELRHCLAELGATPSGAASLARQGMGVPDRNGNSWADIPPPRSPTDAPRPRVVPASRAAGDDDE